MPNSCDNLIDDTSPFETIEDTSLLNTEVFDNCFVEGFLNLNFFQIFASLCLAATCSLATPKTAQAATLVTTVSSKTVAKLVINAKREEPVSNKKVFLAKRTEPMAVHAFPRPVSSKPFHLTSRRFQTTSRKFNRSVVRRGNSIRASFSKEECVEFARNLIPSVVGPLVNTYAPHIAVAESIGNLAIMGFNILKYIMNKREQPIPKESEAVLLAEMTVQLKDALMPYIEEAKNQQKSESEARQKAITQESEARQKAITQESEASQKAITRESEARVKVIEARVKVIEAKEARKNLNNTAKQKRKQELHEAKLKRIED